MKRLTRFLNGLPLRQRFLVGPLVGLAVLGLMTAAFILESQRQSALLLHVAQEDLAGFDRYFDISARLSERHTALFGLLSGARAVDEATLYDRAKADLEAIHAATDELERASEALAARQAHGAVPAALHGQLLARTLEYRRAAAAAVELATVRKEVAAAGLDRANGRFVAMNRAFAAVLDAQRQGLLEQITDQVRRSRVNGILLAGIGVLVAAVLVAVLVMLSRYLARTLEAQVEALGKLGNEAGGSVSVEGAHEVEKMEHAVDAFRHVLTRLRDSERALGAANEALERRVRERTRELAEANAALQESEEQLKRLAFYDTLTGLANRALFDDRLHMAIAQARRQRKAIAVLFVDLDRFKHVNDTLGHDAGDRLLVEVARRIGACARDSDTVGRMGGDEFMVLLTQLDAEADAARAAERIIEAVSRPVLLEERSVLVGASVGISFFPHDGEDAITLQKHADVAMYAAKQAGRGRYRAFGPELLERGDGAS
jgi:diguanylate cyclase (GGDEF)-like protein